MANMCHRVTPILFKWYVIHIMMNNFTKTLPCYFSSLELGHLLLTSKTIATLVA